MEKILKWLEEEIDFGSTIVLACSGGPDSMLLLHLMHQLKNSLKLTLIVAHVNHKLREESDVEEKFLRSYVKDLGLEFLSTSLDELKNKRVSEEEARKKRYAFLLNCIKEKKAQYLFTAHHGDDLIETVLMRLSRGSNLKGYAGILKIQTQENMKIIRPLLDISKDDILEYNRKNNIPFVVDKSNESEVYTRNRYRANVVPFLKKEDRNIHKKYQQFSEEANNYCVFVNNYILEHQFIVDKRILINKIKDESEFIKRKTVELLVCFIQKNDYFDISNDQLNEIMKMFKGRNRRIDLNNGYICIKDYDVLTIKKNTKVNDYNFLFNNFLEYDDWCIKKLKEPIDFSNNTICLCSDEVVLPLYVRNRKKGDSMEVKNLNGKKKIKDIFIDEKILLEKRDALPVVTDSANHILWIPGVKKSKFAKDKTQKYDIILKYEVRKKDE